MAIVEPDLTLDLISDVVASFATRDVARVRALREAEVRLDHQAWRRMAAIGWVGMLVPEELGGAGLGLDAVVIVTRGLGYAGFPEPFVAGAVLAPIVLAGGDGDEVEQRLARTIDGELIVAVGWQGDVVASASGRLSGRSRFVGVAGADAYVVAARDSAGRGLYWVPAGSAGLHVADEQLADGSFSASLELDEVNGELLVPGERGEALLDGAIDTARIALSGELLGIADAALELTLDYLRQRKQFGRAIGSFQALQHRAVDMWISRELAAASLEAAVAVHEDPGAGAQRRAIAARSAKARAATSALAVCKSALQCHGAIGFTDEYDLGIYLNRALALSPWLGNATESRRHWLRLAETLEARS